MYLFLVVHPIQEWGKERIHTCWTSKRKSMDETKTGAWTANDDWWQKRWVWQTYLPLYADTIIAINEKIMKYSWELVKRKSVKIWKYKWSIKNNENISTKKIFKTACSTDVYLYRFECKIYVQNSYDKYFHERLHGWHVIDIHEQAVLALL